MFEYVALLAVAAALWVAVLAVAAAWCIAVLAVAAAYAVLAVAAAWWVAVLAVAAASQLFLRLLPRFENVRFLSRLPLLPTPWVPAWQLFVGMLPLRSYCFFTTHPAPYL